MNLWIRTQDRKKLVLINTLAIAENISGSILGFGIDGRVKVELGYYKTKERALEILDDIQETLCLDEYHYENREQTSYQDCYRYKSNIIAIYEMPEE